LQRQHDQSNAEPQRGMKAHDHMRKVCAAIVVQCSVNDWHGASAGDCFNPVAMAPVTQLCELATNMHCPGASSIAIALPAESQVVALVAARCV
jgi:hypothetical protein